ncbi:hypothetical protein FNV43_RR05249 [Rhamnella rubrinervis]|uniref:RING-type E3 ubiquitin transferase n=1 Tax=Rhamnella rubrinervis TaxID=2594499 RepID=A0A8K0HL01_9ROSA|nr:hypothetical protein FNV43_RR05249 [Rhamnella rubrinervis]
MQQTIVKSSGTDSNVSSGYLNLNSNMMIVLAALLLALMCAFGLNSIVRCARRCSLHSRDVLGNPEQAAARVHNIRGSKNNVLSQIPEMVYREGLVSIPAVTDCPICLGEFGEGEKVRILPKCGHGFHVKCIDTWLECHSSCPLCRRPLTLMNHLAADYGNQDASNVEFS